MNKITLAIAALGLAGNAYAGTPVKSEYFYQTEQQKHQVTPELAFDTQKVKYSASTGTDSHAGHMLNVKYEYGLHEMFSVGAKIGYESIDSESAGSTTKTTQKGVSDLDLFFKGQYALFDGSSLHYGFDLTGSLGDGERDSATGLQKTAMSGGYALVPYVGYQWLLGKSVLGFNVSTEMDLGDRTLKNKGGTGQYKESGYNDTALHAFYEFPIEKLLLGASVGYASRSSLESEISGTTTKTSSGNFLDYKLYTTYEINEMATVIGQVAYSHFLGDKVTAKNSGVLTTETIRTIDKADDFSVQVAGRFTF